MGLAKPRGECVGGALTHFTIESLLPLHGPVSLVGVQFVLCCHFRSITGCSLSGNQILLTSKMKKFTFRLSTFVSIL